MLGVKSADGLLRQESASFFVRLHALQAVWEERCSGVRRFDCRVDERVQLRDVLGE